MDISLDKKNSNEALIKVKVNEGDYQSKVEEKIKDYSKKVSLKGFRPGKVPMGMVKKMYGKSIKVEEISHLLSHKLSDFIKENNLKLLGEPLPEKESTQKIDWDNQTEFEFTYQIGIQEEFDLELSKKVKIKQYEIEVDKKTMDKTIDSLKKQFGNQVNVETVAEEDKLIGKLVSEDGAIDLDGVVLEYDDINTKEFKKFKGAKVGDSITFPINKTVKDHHVVEKITEQSHDDAVKDSRNYTLTINEIIRIEPSEINQEFFDKVLGKDNVKSEEEFKEKVKEVISGNYKRETEYLLRKHIREHFLDNTKINLPDNFLKLWLHETNEGITMEDIEKEYDEYTTALKWDMIQARIAEMKEIKVENSEIRQKAGDMIVNQLGGPSILQMLGDKIDQFIDNYLQAEEGKNYRNVHKEVTYDKIFESVKNEITLTEKKVSFEEFEKIVLK
ncbi:MAG: trigger factor [Cyclobacteriaceae bacterium]|nr:trigger factor [Cyclobacteriaceae bacterium]